MIRFDAPRSNVLRWRSALQCTSFAALIAGAVGAIVHRIADPPVVYAQVNGQNDVDGDGLSDNLEHLLGTSPDLADSDFDGFSDAEEYARRSSPIMTWETPGTAPASMGMGASIGGGLHSVSVIYLQDGDLAGKSLTFGLMINGHMTPLPQAIFVQQSTLTYVSAATPGELVAVLDVVLSPAVFRRTGSLSLYTIVEGAGVACSDAVNLAFDGSMFVQRMELVTQSGGSPGTEMVVASGGGTVLRPLGGGGGTGGTPDSICSQTTTPVGQSGAVMTEEVTSASCETGWDSTCDSSSCAGSVGTTIQVIDPAALVGG